MNREKKHILNWCSISLSNSVKISDITIDQVTRDWQIDLLRIFQSKKKEEMNQLIDKSFQFFFLPLNICLEPRPQMIEWNNRQIKKIPPPKKIEQTIYVYKNVKIFQFYLEMDWMVICSIQCCKIGELYAWVQCIYEKRHNGQKWCQL